MSINHSEREHARLSASSAKRWINCPASVKLEESYGVEGDKHFANEGTLAHEVNENSLRGTLGLISKQDMYAKHEAHKSNPLYNDDMQSYSNAYCTFILKLYRERRALYPDAKILIEYKSDWSQLIPESWGTVDNSIIDGDTLHIVDFKYGQGVPVSAEENEQLKLYALGAILEFKELHGFSKVKLIVYQPRISNEGIDYIPSEYETTVDNIIYWAMNEALPKAVLALEGNAEINEGEHCKFCKVKGRCKRLSLNANIVPTNTDVDPRIFSDVEIAKFLELAPLIRDFLKGVENYALNRAIEGHVWDGYEVTEGRTNRTWTSEAEAIELMDFLGYESYRFIENKLMTPAKIEKELGKKAFKSDLSTVVMQPVGTATLSKKGSNKNILPTGVASAVEDFK